MTGSSWTIPVAVAVIAFAVRLTFVLRGGGLHAYMGYDDGVYYTAAAKLVSGAVPYRDFVLLHPPVIVLVLAPFAALARLITDRDAMAVARVAFMVLGAVNAGLTARVASVLGRRAAVVAGGFTAVWFHAAYVDRTTLLEPLGTLALLVALLLLRPGEDDRPHAGRRELLAGVALGLGTCVKVWGVVPYVVIAVGLLVGGRRRTVVRLTLGAAAAGLAVMAPFLLAAPGATIRMIILAQTGRPDDRTSLPDRVQGILGVTQVLGSEHTAVTIALSAALTAALVALTVVALRAPEARRWVALLLAHGVVLLAAPIYFPHYASFLAVPLSLVLGAAATVVHRDLSRRGTPGWVGWAASATAAAVLVGLGGVTIAHPVGVRYPGARLAAFLPAGGCVRADDPGALIQLNALGRDLRRGCTVHADFTGITYDQLARRDAAGKPVSRRRNAGWQSYAQAYLLSGSATVLVRGPANGFNRSTTATLSRLPVLGRVGPWKVLGPASP